MQTCGLAMWLPDPRIRKLPIPRLPQTNHSHSQSDVGKSGGKVTTAMPSWFRAILLNGKPMTSLPCSSPEDTSRYTGKRKQNDLVGSPLGDELTSTFADGATMAEITIKVGDVLNETADVLISPANPWLNLSGGMNGGILLRGGEAIQEEVQAYLRSNGRSAVQPGTVVLTGPGSLKFKHIFHAVAIDPFYDSSVDLVRRTIEAALAQLQRLVSLDR